MTTRRVVFKFPKSLVEQPITYRLVKDFDLRFNILRARVTDEEGLLVLGLEGEELALDKALSWVENQGVVVEPLSRDIVRDDARCVDCGACINVCPTGALILDTATREVSFEAEECVACELCVPACPYRAMQVTF
jgi:L-aspartate semialdehyde sulfurtransferase ferredoxin